MIRSYVPYTPITAFTFVLTLTRMGHQDTRTHKRGIIAGWRHKRRKVRTSGVTDEAYMFRVHSKLTPTSLNELHSGPDIVHRLG